MKLKSLAFRLFATSAAWTLLVLPIAGLIIYELYRDDVQATFENLEIELLEVPEPAIDGEPGTDPLLRGVYHGTPITERESAPALGPDRVRIFKRNVERLVLDRDELVEQLRITLLHEVGHHLGWDEDDLEARGLA